MMMFPLAGVDGGIPVDDAIQAALESNEKPWAVKVSVDISTKEERLVLGGTVPSGGSLADAWTAVCSDMLEDHVPCIVLIRLQDDLGSVPWASANNFAMLGWTPDGSPVKLRMLCASSRKTLQDKFSSYIFQEYNKLEKSDINLQAFVEAKRMMTEEERRDVMSKEELELEDVKAKISAEQRAAPKRMMGMAVLSIEIADSFKGCVDAASSGDMACIGRLTGDKAKTLEGETIMGVSGPADLKGKLPQDEAMYILVKCSAGGMVLISWLPEGMPGRAKMSFASFKSSVVGAVKDLLDGTELHTAEVTEDDDLTDDLGA